MEDSNLVAAFFMPPGFESRAFQEGLVVADGTSVTYLVLQFLTAGELSFYGQYGPQATGSLLLNRAPEEGWCAEPDRCCFAGRGMQSVS